MAFRASDRMHSWFTFYCLLLEFEEIPHSRVYFEEGTLLVVIGHLASELVVFLDTMHPGPAVAY